METDGLFEGDIFINKSEVTARTVLPGSGWPGGIMIYKISQELLPYQNLIKGAMHAISSKSCVKFRAAGFNDRSYVNYQSRGYGCYSYLGKLPFQQQPLNLGRECLDHGTIIHETMHALGFYHE